MPDDGCSHCGRRGECDKDAHATSALADGGDALSEAHNRDGRGCSHGAGLNGSVGTDGHDSRRACGYAEEVTGAHVRLPGSPAEAAGRCEDATATTHGDDFPAREGDAVQGILIARGRGRRQGHRKPGDSSVGDVDAEVARGCYVAIGCGRDALKVSPCDAAAVMRPGDGVRRSQHFSLACAAIEGAATHSNEQGA